MSVLDTVELQVGLQKALGISPYVDHPSYWDEVFNRGLPLACVILILSLIIGLTIMAVADSGGSEEGGWGLLAFLLFIAFIVPSVSKHFSVEIADEGRLTSAIEQSIPSDYVSQEIRDSFAESGWAVDCADSEDSLLCGGTRLDTVVPAQRENGEKADVSLRINYDNFLDSNNVNSGNHDQRIVAPGEPLTINVDVVKVAGER